MPDNGEDILDTESEHEDPMETDLFPTVNPRTPGQVPYYNSFPYFVFTPHVIPFRTPLVTPQNVPQNIPEHFHNLPRMGRVRSYRRIWELRLSRGEQCHRYTSK